MRPYGKTDRKRIRDIEMRLRRTVGSTSTIITPGSGSGPGIDTTAFHNGGDSFAGAATIGTNDNNNVILERNNTTLATLKAAALEFIAAYSLRLGATAQLFGAGVEELQTILDTYNGVLAAVIKNGSNGNSAFSGWFSMDDLATFVNGMGTMGSGKTPDGVTSPNDGWVGIGPLSGITAAGSQRLIIHNRFNSGVIRFSTAGGYRGTILSSGEWIVGAGTSLSGSEKLKVEGSIYADNDITAATGNVTANSGSYLFSMAPTLFKLSLTTPSAPAANQFQITANTGRYTVLTYDGDNTQQGFDVDWTSGGGWIARHSAVAWIRKNASRLSFYGSTGNSVGSAATETLMGYWDLASRALVVSQQTLGNEVLRLQSTATNDDPTDSFYQARVATTDATLTTLHTVAIPASTTVFIEATVRARRTGGASGTAEDGASYVIHGTYKNAAGTATLIGSVVTVSSAEDQAAWDCQFNASSGNVLIQIQGAASNNVTWHGTIKTCAVGS